MKGRCACERLKITGMDHFCKRGGDSQDRPNFSMVNAGLVTYLDRLLWMQKSKKPLTPAN